MNRLPLALFLSALVLIGWTFVMGPRGPKDSAAEVGAAVPAEMEPLEAEAEPVQAEPVAEPEAPAPAPAQLAPVATAAVAEGGVEETLVLEVGNPGEPGCYRAVFTNRGAALVELRMGNFYDRVGLSAEEHLDRQHWVELLGPAELDGASTASLVWRTSSSSERLVSGPLAQALWEMRAVEGGVDFALPQPSGVVFKKRVRFEPGSYDIAVELELENRSCEQTGKANFYFTPAEVVLPESDERFYIEPQAAAAGRTARAAGRSDPPPPEVQTVPRKGKPMRGVFDVPAEVLSFAGVHNKYFACLLRGADAHATSTLKGAEWRSVFDRSWAEANPAKADQAWRYMASDVLLELDVPPIGGTETVRYAVYAGPKERELMSGYSPDFAALLRADVNSWLPGDASVAIFLIEVLKLLDRLTGNWGVSIILMTMLIRLILFPLNRRSQTSMARYQSVIKRLQPKIDEIKVRHADDLDKQRKAQAELMQKEGAMPPLGGCLPVFVQLPVFFGLFTAVRTSFDLRQQPFTGWITDLSKPDRLLRLDLHTGLPLIGTIEYLNLLPPLMVALWIGQQMVMPKPADEQARRMQRMMMFMPVVMGFFLYNYAAGLSLYMITQSLLGIFEISVIKKVWPVDDTAPVKKSSGFLARLAEKQAAQMKRVEELRRHKSATRSQSARTRRRKRDRR
jgi:YidC/Oxa1 family membrane protein insertase